MTTRETDRLTFAREETDTYFGKTCHGPDCAECVYRDSMRKLLGTLVEAAQLAAVCRETAHEMWGSCQDEGCRFERDQMTMLRDALVSITGSYKAAQVCWAQWYTLPADWDLREREALTNAVILGNSFSATTKE